jgi:AcrR family transcriptional regulator
MAPMTASPGIAYVAACMPAKDRARRRVLPRQRRAQHSVNAILEASLQLLEDGGYDKLTTNRIAERAGVNVALVYRYFAGKESIVATLLELAAAQTEAALIEAIAQTQGQALRDGLRAIVIALSTTPSPNVHRALVEHVDVASRRPLLDALRTRLRDRFEQFLHRHAGEIRPLDDPGAALFVLEHALEAATHAIAFYRPPSLPAERTITVTVDLVMSYLALRDR